MAATRFFSPRRVWISIVLLVLIGVGAVIWFLSRPEDKGPSAPKEDLHAQTPDKHVGQGQSRPAGRRLIPGVDFPFEVKTPRVNKDGRWIRPGDCDGDGLKDDWEMRRYGTLKYNSYSHRKAPRIDLPPRKPDPGDTDNDKLPDKWEIKYFGHLLYNQYDDPDEDGWPNGIEYRNQETGSDLDPTRIDLLSPKRRPRLGYSSYNKRMFSTMTREFWRKQDVARERLQREGGQALVEARMVKRSRRPTTNAATAASTRPSG